jgi:aryl-alcohol dehydrogenase-like predicted oxidoreductase
MRVGFGCVTLGSGTGPSGRAGIRLVQAAVDAGVTLFDTADAYGSGASERTLGRALAGRRDEVEIATKAGYRFQERSAVERQVRRVLAPVARRRGQGSSATRRAATGSYASQDFSPTHLRSALEGSLRRLGTDHVDVYQLHGPRQAHPELVPVLHEFVDAGMVRRVGVGAEGLDVACQWVPGVSTPSETVRPIDVLQVPFGPLDPDAATVLLTDARRCGVEIWARGLFGGGVMAAEVAGSTTIDAADTSRLRALRAIADELDLDLFELAISFVRSFSDVSVVMLGMSSERHLERNLDMIRSANPLPLEVVERVCALSGARATPDGAG